MKLSFVSSAIISIGSISTAFASNYPPDYAYQTASALHDGAALFVHVGSGCDSADLFGYNKTGPLAQMNPEKIEAVVTAECRTSNGDTTKRVSVITLGKEWRGAGYLSPAFSFYSLLPNNCESLDQELRVAFSANGLWDSLGGNDYRINYGFYKGVNGRRLEVFHTGMSGGCNNIVMPIWDFVANQLNN